MSFQVDYQDHYSYFDATISRFNFLQFEEHEWRRFNPSLHYQNRMRHADYLDLYSAASLDLAHEEPLADAADERLISDLSQLGIPSTADGRPLSTRIPGGASISRGNMNHAMRLDPRWGDHGYHQLRQLAAALRDETSRLPADASILDIGCGSKPYRSLFRGSYLGLDLIPVPGVVDALAAAERLPVRTGSVSVLLTTQHLEHAADPGCVLDEARRVLTAQGTLLLSTHGVWVFHPDPLDLWRWTEQGLVMLIESHGFQVERVHHQGEVITAGLSLVIAPLARLTSHHRLLPRLVAFRRRGRQPRHDRG